MIELAGTYKVSSNDNEGESNEDEDNIADFIITNSRLSRSESYLRCFCTKAVVILLDILDMGSIIFHDNI